MKVANFGLSKTGPTLDQTHVSTAEKVLPEVLNPVLPKEQVNIAEWAMHWRKKGMLEKIIDPHLVGTINPGSLKKLSETAEKCLEE